MGREAEKRAENEATLQALKGRVQAEILGARDRMDTIAQNNALLEHSARQQRLWRDARRRERDRQAHQQALEANREELARAGEVRAHRQISIRLAQARLQDLEAETAGLGSRLADTLRFIDEQRMELLQNLTDCLQIRMEPAGTLRILHYTIPIDGNYNRLPPDDLNALLGHIAQITVHLSRVFQVRLPLELVPCSPVPYFKLGGAEETLLLWMDPQDTTGRGVDRFVTALGLLNYCITWLASVVLAEPHHWNGLANLDMLLAWTPAPYAPPSPLRCAVAEVVRETFYSWNVHTGDGVRSAIPFPRLADLISFNLARFEP